MLLRRQAFKIRSRPSLAKPESPTVVRSKLSRDTRSFPTLVRLTVRAGNNHGVAVRVFDPDLAMTWTVAFAFRRVAVRCSHDRCIELSGARDDVVKVGHLAEPQQNAVANLDIRSNEEPVVVFDAAMMKLKNKNAAGEQPLVLGTSMITAETQQLLIPAA